MIYADWLLIVAMLAIAGCLVLALRARRLSR